MARYKLTISGVFDIDNVSNTSDELVFHLVRNCCPGSFGFNVGESCSMTNCFKCWENALKMGVRANVAENVHVERLG